MLPRRRFLFLAASSGLLFAGCGKPDGGTTGPLRMGMDLSYPPFEMQDSAGKPDGVSVKLAEAIAADLGRPLEIVPMDFSGLIPALKTGNIDLILSSMTATPERRKSIAFSEPYAFTGLALLVGKDSGIASIEDLKTTGRTLAVKAGTTGDAWAGANLSQVKRVVFEDPAACVAEVVQGRADAFIFDQLSILKYSARHADTTRGLLRPFVEEAWAIGIAPGNDALRQQVDAFLVKFRAKNGFGELGDRFLKDEKKLLSDAGIPFLLR